MRKLLIVILLALTTSVFAINYDTIHKRIINENWDRDNYFEFFDQLEIANTDKIVLLNDLINRLKYQSENNFALSVLYNVLGSEYILEGLSKDANNCFLKSVDYSFLISNKEYTKKLFFDLHEYLINGKFFENTIEYGGIILSKYSLSKKDSSKIYSILGVSYSSVNDYFKSIDLHSLSAKLYYQLGDSLNLAKEYFNLGVGFERVGLFDNSLQFYYKSSSIWNYLNNNDEVIRVKLNIGNNFLARKRYRKAVRIFSDVLKQRDSFPDLFLHISGDTEVNIASAYYLDNNIDSSKYWYNRAVHTAKNTDDSKLLIISYLGLYNLNTKSGVDCSCYLKNAENLLDTTHVSYQDIRILSEFSKIYYNKGNFEKALIYFKLKQHFLDKYDFLKDGYKESLFDKKEELQDQKREFSCVIRGKEKQIAFFHRFGFIGGLAFLILIFALWHTSVKNKLIKSNIKQLSDQKRLLEEANHTKKIMLSIIGHDLRGPIGTASQLMNIIVNNIENNDHSKAKKLIEELKMSNDNVFEMLNSLLLWANALDKKIEINSEYVNVNDIVTSCLQSLSNVIKNKKVVVKYDYTIDLFCSVDKNIVSVILRNLISNAIKYSYSGGEIIVCASVKEDILFIDVKDNGIGMSQALCDSLFDDSENKSNFGTEDEEGTGIGLKLCKLFVNAVSGKIYCKSEFKKGSIFCVEIPVK